VRPQLGGCDDGVAAVSGDAHALELGTKDEFGLPELFEELVAVTLGGGGKNGGVVEVVDLANIAQYLHAITVCTKVKKCAKVKGSYR
jgi:hypothetical protein